ncbi:hypothetical protein BDQ12DRAFT_677553 [Crucibulum laeve]|uniref:Chromatin modification-related protein n=1 Tax=Crucibulum laeve TaxID=68775 RepID=A0A5C3M9G0_9AGAR|nr:hypothetical protein BDQ12DRAFT_677553 [Crucibulum laeve]
MPPTVMAPPRPSSVASSSSSISTAYTLSLLSEYTHTLDSLPIDLSRNFADLRELDAVLSSSMLTITSKVRALTQMIEDRTASNETQLWLMNDIAEEASRLKLGGEDKIRVACQAADNLKAHSNHLRGLVEHIPDFDITTLNRKTVYPHVAARSFMPAVLAEPGRRRRGGFSGSLLVASNPEPSPAKRKRVPRDDDVDVTKSPKKDRIETTSRARANARKKIERAVSPSESVVSVTSHPQPPPIQSNRGGNSSRGGGAASAAAKRRANAAARNPTPLAAETFPSPHDQIVTSHSQGSSSSRRGGANGSAAGGSVHAQSQPAFDVPPASTAHPSLPAPFPTGPGVQYDHLQQLHAANETWTPPLPQQLEGPGMPVRATSIHSAVSASAASNALGIASGGGAGGTGTDGAATEAGDGDGDNDDGRTYCFCDGVSYGEMIACDEASCEREWFHLTCIGLAVPPQGRWFCEACKSKRNKRTGRGGKKRTGGGRGGAKGT